MTEMHQTVIFLLLGALSSVFWRHAGIAALLSAARIKGLYGGRCSSREIQDIQDVMKDVCKEYMELPRFVSSYLTQVHCAVSEFCF